MGIIGRRGNTMQWNDFVSSVRQWSTARGIYEHSTATAQALKACSEAGELCDAVIKGDRAAMVDAVGDVAVCLVNVSALHNCGGLHVEDGCDEVYSLHHGAARVAERCAVASMTLAMDEIADVEIQEALWSLDDFCNFAGLDFLQCCESAWNEIKDRKGRMVEGGAFVKE